MKERTTSSWERLSKVIDSSDQPTINAFAHSIGLKRGENLYQIRRGNNEISKKLAMRINSVYPEFSISWLICGQNPAKTDSDIIPVDAVRIPYYENFALHYRGEETKPEKYLTLSQELCHGAQFATLCKDNTLAPKLVGGSYVLMRKNAGEVLYGAVYLVIAKDFRLFRIIRKSKFKKAVSKILCKR